MIYADNAATTKISDSVFEKMLPFLRERYGNASSQYSLGVTARRAIEQARKQVAVAVGAAPAEIIFTSSGSEANSWVLRGVTNTHRGKPVHIITSSIEHSSVLSACPALESEGVEVTLLPVDYTGRVSVEDVEAAIKPHTRLVSVMLANNEIGTIQPVGLIGQLLKGKGILFHTDAVQAVGHIPVDINELQVDFLTASAHKFNGAKGTGILYKRSGFEWPLPILGTEHKDWFHVGTENVAGIVAAGFAIEESVHEMDENATRLRAMVEAMVEGIKERIPTVTVNGAPAERLPGIVNLGFDGVSGESLMHLLDLKGVCVSTGSACVSGSGEPSHVLLALGLTERQARSAIRISYGRYNTLQEAEEVATAVCGAYGKIVGR
jgi:cysteine desulfurase